MKKNRYRNDENGSHNPTEKFYVNAAAAYSLDNLTCNVNSGQFTCSKISSLQDLLVKGNFITNQITQTYPKPVLKNRICDRSILKSLNAPLLDNQGLTEDGKQCYEVIPILYSYVQKAGTEVTSCLVGLFNFEYCQHLKFPKETWQTFNNRSYDCEDLDHEIHETVLPNNTKITESSNTRFEQYYDKCMQKGCGLRLTGRSKRVINGTGSKKGAWPWMALVKSNNNNVCGGTLISQRYIVSAAHCFHRNELNRYLNPEDFEIYLNLLHIPITESNIQEKKVESFYFHKAECTDFQNIFVHDIVLLKIKPPADLSSRVSPVCLPTPTSVFINTTGFVAGYGYVNNAFGIQVRSSSLQETMLDILDREECVNWYIKSGEEFKDLIIPNGIICAGHKNGTTDACKGDSGGPLMVERTDGTWVLVGIVSTGNACSHAFRPGLYVDVPHYSTWIKKIVFSNI